MLRLKLRKILRDRGITQKDFAVMCGMSRNAITVLCHDPRQIRLETIDALCTALTLTPSDLFEDGEE